jgi:hypothetical protein
MGSSLAQRKGIQILVCVQMKPVHIFLSCSKPYTHQVWLYHGYTADSIICGSRKEILADMYEITAVY